MKVKLVPVLAVLVFFPLVAGFSWLAADNGSGNAQKQDKKNQTALAASAKTAHVQAANVSRSQEPIAKRTDGAALQQPPAHSANHLPPASLHDVQNVSRTLKSLEATPGTGALKVEQNVHASSTGLARESLEVVKLQKQINDILAANKVLQQRQSAQLVQIKKISEEAAIHRRLLEDLERNKPKNEEIPATNVDEILRQEKIRLIRQETEKNKAYVARLAAHENPSSGVS